MSQTPELMPPHIVVRDSALNPSASPGAVKEVQFKLVDGRELYKVWLYLAGPRLPFVDLVVYRLHPSFVQPVREVARSPANPNCALLLWTWGIFDVKVEVRGKKGEYAELSHTMGYDKEFSEPGLKFVQVSPDA